jgi:hypothetical protein
VTDSRYRVYGLNPLEAYSGMAASLGKIGARDRSLESH